ncbi:MAG: hypothetical protein H0T75_17260 [Rhizobiales bacterium]|nr:hypothetical protein [Hyphomicrobiales bacterium]
MEEKLIRPLRSEADYDAALDGIERYFDDEPLPGTTDADRFDLLAIMMRSISGNPRCEHRERPRFAT